MCTARASCSSAKGSTSRVAYDHVSVYSSSLGNGGASSRIGRSGVIVRMESRRRAETRERAEGERDGQVRRQRGGDHLFGWCLAA